MNSKILQNLNICLLHDQMHDKTGQIVTTSLTMIDLHDIARTACTYGANGFYVAHPATALRNLARQLKKHWDVGYGSTYNPNRKDALKNAHLCVDLDEVIHRLHLQYEHQPVLVATSAKDGGERSSFKDFNNTLQDNPEQQYVMLLGTGWGMSDAILDRTEIFLEPVHGAGEYNHLSVRSACAIMLDRILNARG